MVKIYTELSELKTDPKKDLIKKWLNILDSLTSMFIVAPLAVGCWRGTWDLIIHYEHLFPLWESLFASTFTLFLMNYLRPILDQIIIERTKYTKSMCKTITRILINRIYHYIFLFASIMTWRCTWDIVPVYLSPELWPAVIVSIICFIPLVIMRAVRNLIAPPIVIITDSKEFAFNFPTRFRIDGTREPGLYILDCLFSVLVIGSLVVFVWRGLWVLLDLKLFPENQKHSAWASLIIGYAIVGITFSMQPIMKWACEKLEGFWRIVVADIFLFVSFIGTVNVWRGVWQLLDCYFLPDNKLLSDWITHGVSLVLLVLLNCSNSVLVRGVYIDAEEPAGQCVIFPVYYIRLFFQKERTKKQKRLMEKLEKIDQNNTVLLIEKPQLNHAPTSIDTKVKQNSCGMMNDDVKNNDEFSESDKINETLDINKNGEHKILCDDE